MGLLLDGVADSSLGAAAAWCEGATAVCSGTIIELLGRTQGLTSTTEYSVDARQHSTDETEMGKGGTCGLVVPVWGEEAVTRRIRGWFWRPKSA